MTEEYFVSSFVGGLNDEIRSAVKMFKPQNVQEAVEGSLFIGINCGGLNEEAEESEQGK